MSEPEPNTASIGTESSYDDANVPASEETTNYRRTALGLFALGALAIAAGVEFPDSRTVLLALGGTGLFAGVLTYYLTPTGLAAASVGEDVYETLAADRADILSELHLSGTATYVPTDSEDAHEVRLFVPPESDDELPGEAALGRAFVGGADGRRGVTFQPTGARLFAEFERTSSTSLAADPERAADQLASAVVERFELADSVRSGVAPTRGQVTLGVSDSAFGPVGQFDHPLPSFVAVGLAAGLDRPVTVETTRTDDDRFDYIVSYDWQSGD